jgi:5-methylcytosine-specific restriction endonuclease McrA
LQTYFDAHDKYQPRKLQEMETVTVPISSDALADIYRKVCNYVCQACGVGCSIAPQLLHLHFEDGDPTHTDRSNLYMLCVDCHAHQPGHDHMKIQPIVQADIEGVQLLRAQQRIVSLKHVRTLTPSTFNALLG